MKTELTELEEARKGPLALKALHDAELVPFGERGELRPRSRGKSYGIPPTDGTYKPCQTDQTGKDTVDLNAVMKRYEKTGKLTELIQLGMGGEGGFYGDFTDAPTFQEALNITIHAQQQFALLDAAVRERFKNDPAQFLAFVGDQKNVDEMEKMGLLKPEVVAARQAARLKGQQPPSTASAQAAGGQATPPSQPA